VIQITRLPAGPESPALKFDRYQFARRSMPASEETCLSWADATRMQVRSAPGEMTRAVPLWTRSDAKIAAVVKAKLWAMALGAKRTEHADITMAEVATIEKWITERLTALAAQGHSDEARALETWKRCGGQARYYAALLFRSYRLGHDSVVVAEDLGIGPATVRQTLFRLCKIARELFPDPELHMTKRTWSRGNPKVRTQ